MVKGKKEEIEDEYEAYPILIIAGDPTKYVWPVMRVLENNNGIRLHACEPHMPTISRIKELTSRYLEEVRRRDVEVISRKNKSKLQVTEIVLEFIPACRR